MTLCLLDTVLNHPGWLQRAPNTKTLSCCRSQIVSKWFRKGSTQCKSEKTNHLMKPGRLQSYDATPGTQRHTQTPLLLVLVGVGSPAPTHGVAMATRAKIKQPPRQWREQQPSAGIRQRTQTHNPLWPWHLETDTK